MKITERKKQIIQILLESAGPLTTSDIANRLKVTSRTIRTDLSELETIILSHNLILVKKPSIGISIIGNKQDKDTLFLDITDDTSFVESYTKEYRHAVILAKLLMGEKSLYIDQLAKNLFVSRSAIEKDIQDISNQLHSYNLSLVRKGSQGLFIKGDEVAVRQAISSLAASMNKDNLSFESILNKHMLLNIDSIIEIVTYWDKKNNLSLSEVNIRNLSFHIAIILIRMRYNKTIQFEGPKDAMTFDQKVQIQMKELFTYIEHAYKQQIPESEQKYLLLHLIGMMLENKEFCDENLIVKLRLQAEQIAEEFINNIEKIVSLDLTNNKSFKESIILHLLPSIYRLKNGLNLYNPLLTEIKTNFTSAFELSKIINSSFKKYLNVSASEEEIAYIALHLSVAIEQRKKPLRVAIVCPLGIGISRLIKLKLEENFPMIIFENYSGKEIKRIEECDLVLDTSLHEYKIPSLRINPLLERTDIRRIDTLISNRYSSESKAFSKQTILIEHKPIRKEEVLSNLSNRLKLCGYVTNQFLDGVMKREEMGSTEVGDGIVLTHGFHKDVLKTQIAFAKLDKPIIWNTEKVNFIVMLAIEAKDAENVMQMNWLYKMLIDSEVITQITSCNDSQEIFDILVNFSNKYV